MNSINPIKLILDNNVFNIYNKSNNYDTCNLKSIELAYKADIIEFRNNTDSYILKNRFDDRYIPDNIVTIKCLDKEISVLYPNINAIQNIVTQNKILQFYTILEKCLNTNYKLQEKQDKYMNRALHIKN